jgi:heat shock protein HslJ
MRYFISFLVIFVLGCTSQYKIFKDNLRGKNLFLERFGDIKKDPPRNALIVLYNGGFKGFGGCNDYSGVFTIKKRHVHFKIKYLGTQVCEESYREREYFKTLVKTTNLVIKNKRVYFMNDDDKILLVFKQ